MPFLTLTYADGTEQVVETDHESRVVVAGGSAVAFHTSLGLVSASYQPAEQTEVPEPDWDDPAFRKKVRKLLKDEAHLAPPQLTLSYADGDDQTVASDAPVVEVEPGVSVPFEAVTGLVSVSATDDDPRPKPKKKK